MKYRLNTGGIPLKDYFETLTLIGSGADHKVYQHPKYKNLVVKCGFLAVQHGNIFQKNQNLYPIVYDIMDCGNTVENYIVIEKLNNDLFVKYWNEMFIDAQKLKDEGIELSFTRSDFLYIERLHHIKKKISQNYMSFFNVFYESILNTCIEDVHERNFGMTLDGKIKVLDI